MQILSKGKKVFTHLLNIEVLMNDLTTRNIDLKFNGSEVWEDTCSGLETGNMLYRALINVLDNDKNTLGWKGTLIHLESGRKTITFAPYAKGQLQ